MYTPQPTCDLCVDARERRHAISARGFHSDQLPLLTLAAMQGRLDHVRHYVEHVHCDVDTLDSAGTTPLQRAAVDGHVDTVRYLIQSGAAVVTRVGQDTVLHLAAAKGHADVVQLLLTGGASIDALNADNFTPLLVAVRANHERVVHVLIANGADVRTRCPLDAGDIGTVLHLAAQSGHVPLVHFLLGVVALDVHQRTRRDNATPLHVAARHGHATLVRFLVARHRADVHAQDARGMTALHYTCDYPHHTALSRTQHDAVERRHVDVVTALLAAGADIKTRRQGDHATPLRCAAGRGHLYIAKTLLERGARSNAATTWLFALFWWATEPHKVKFLLAHGQRPASVGGGGVRSDSVAHVDKDDRRDSVSSDGTQLDSPTTTAPLDARRRMSSVSSVSCWRRRSPTELHTACFNCDVAALVAVLATLRRVDDTLLEARTHSDGLTALHVAAQRGWKSGVVTLLQAGADVDAEATANGATPLHLAAERGHVAVLQHLLAYGARVDVCDHTGATPLVVAVRSGRSRALMHLLRYRYQYRYRSSGVVAATSQSRTLSGRDHRSSYVDLRALSSDRRRYQQDATLAQTFDSTRTTALHVAAFIGSLERVRQLVWDGDDVNTRDQDGATPVWLAAVMGHAAVVAFLADHGANVDVVANNGASVALGAAEFGHREVLAFLTGESALAMDGDRRSRSRLSLQDHASDSRLSIYRASA